MVRLVSNLNFSEIILEGILALVGSEQRSTVHRSFLLQWPGEEIVEYNEDRECEFVPKNLDVVSKPWL